MEGGGTFRRCRHIIHPFLLSFLLHFRVSTTIMALFVALNDPISFLSGVALRCGVMSTLSYCSEVNYILDYPEVFEHLKRNTRIACLPHRRNAPLAKRRTNDSFHSPPLSNSYGSQFNCRVSPLPGFNLFFGGRKRALLTKRETASSEDVTALSNPPPLLTSSPCFADEKGNGSGC